MAQIWRVNGTVEDLDFGPKLDELQKAVGGYIELVRLNNGRGMYINEEGKIEGLPMNDKATKLAHEHKAIFENDVIVGDAVLMSPEEMRADSE